MRPSDYYQDLISSITEDDVKRVAYQMTLHVGSDNMVDINRVYGKVNTSTVRKTREIIERLVRTRHADRCVQRQSRRFIIRDEAERAMVTAEPVEIVVLAKAIMTDNDLTATVTYNENYTCSTCTSRTRAVKPDIHMPRKSG